MFPPVGTRTFLSLTPPTKVRIAVSRSSTLQWGHGKDLEIQRWRAELCDAVMLRETFVGGVCPCKIERKGQRNDYNTVSFDYIFAHKQVIIL